MKYINGRPFRYRFVENNFWNESFLIFHKVKMHIEWYFPLNEIVRKIISSLSLYINLFIYIPNFIFYPFSLLENQQSIFSLFSFFICSNISFLNSLNYQVHYFIFFKGKINYRKWSFEPHRLNVIFERLFSIHMNSKIVALIIIIIKYLKKTWSFHYSLCWIRFLHWGKKLGWVLLVGWFFPLLQHVRQYKSFHFNST